MSKTILITGAGLEYFQMRNGVGTKAIAFSDAREFDDFWTQVSPAS